MPTPELTAVLIAGVCRERAQRVLTALGRQTVAERMEIVVVDLAPAGEAPLDAPANVPVDYRARPDIGRWGSARLEAVRAANAPVVAFIEDHCFPRTDWAEHVLAAHEGPWPAVGYAFVNANPESYSSRAGMLARYGLFTHPVESGPSRYVSGNNISYKREALLALGDELEALLDIDFNLQEALRARGGTLYVEARAVGAHQNYARLSGECQTGRPYCRLLAARRARHWSAARKLCYGLLSPAAAPVLRFFRLAASLRKRRPLWRPFLVASPAIVWMYLSDALGESAGYLFGAGDAEAQVLRWELSTERTAR